ncbi:hypothetical protein C883_3343 [Bacillus stratosphericus LAMA 585]|nr:hypothetical protein C883_3343 [Bacillus stratosphericus LAMA 585]
MKIVIVASVAIKGAIFPFVIKSPLIIPRMAPMIHPTMMARIGSKPDTIKPAVRALDSARMAPTDKSIPPVKITNVMPKAMRALMEICLSKFKMFNGSKKAGFKIETMATRMMSPKNGPSFCMMLSNRPFEVSGFMLLPSCS